MNAQAMVELYKNGALPMFLMDIEHVVLYSVYAENRSETYRATTTVNMGWAD